MNQKGSGIAMFAISLTVVVGMAAFAVDVGVMMTARNQLQTGVDASTLAAATGLQVSESEAISRGISISHQDTLIDKTLDLEEEEFSFIDNDKVHVAATRNIDLYFSQFFGLQKIPIHVEATALLGNRDIMLIIDRSGSMDDDTPTQQIIQNPTKDKKDKKDKKSDSQTSPQIVMAPQPITDTMEAAIFFVDRISANTFTQDEVGLISYSTEARLDEPLGRNFGIIRDKILDFEADGWTNIGGAIHTANEQLLSQSRMHTSRVQILLSDGMTNRPGTGSPTNRTAINYAKEKADFAAANKIKIYTISLGRNTDRDLMDYIAEKTGGYHFYSPTTAELQQIFDEIASRVPAILIS